MVRLLVWDFDETLAFRPGRFSGALLEIVREHAPDLPVTREDIHNQLVGCLPWHHSECICAPCSSDLWWARLVSAFRRVFLAVGVCETEAEEFAWKVRSAYADCSKWNLYPDSRAALECFARRGWTQVLLSNHVPELRAILACLQIAQFFVQVFNSAETGIEKPNREAFLAVERAFPHARRRVMVGDSLQSDIRGAAEAGWEAVLVRRCRPGLEHGVPDLLALDAILAPEERSRARRGSSD